jgi:hypothetical protein
MVDVGVVLSVSVGDMLLVGIALAVAVGVTLSVSVGDMLRVAISLSVSLGRGD